MKKGIVVLTVMLFAVGLLAGPVCEKAFAKEMKIAYVDLAKVFDEYSKTKDSEKVLEEKGKSKEAERAKLVDEVKKLKDEQNMLSEESKPGYRSERSSRGRRFLDGRKGCCSRTKPISVR